MALNLQTQRAVLLAKSGDTATWLKQEVREFTATVAVDEAETQVRQNNLPSQVMIDRKSAAVSNRMVDALKRGTLTIDATEMKRQIVWNFAGGTAKIYEAVEFAYKEIVRRTRVLTGAGIRSIYFWLEDPNLRSGVKKGSGTRASTLGEVKRWLEKASPGAAVHILGPTTIYRRALVYFPKGKTVTRATSNKNARKKAQGIIRYEKEMTKKKGRPFSLRNPSSYLIERSQEGKPTRYRILAAIHLVVAGQVKRRFKNIYAAYSFTKSHEPLGDKAGEHIPRLYISGSIKTLRVRKPKNG